MKENSDNQNRSNRFNTKLTGSIALFIPSKKAVFLNIESFVILTLIPAAYILLLMNILGPISPQQELNVNNPWLTPVLLLGIPLFLLLIPTMPYLQVQSSKDRQVNILDAFKGGLNYFWKVHIINILVGVAVTIGLIFFIVPGIILLRRYFLAPYYAIDQDLKPLDAMKQSAKETKPYSGSVYGVLGVILFLSLIGSTSNISQLISSVLSFLYSCAPAIRYLQINRLNRIS